MSTPVHVQGYERGTSLLYMYRVMSEVLYMYRIMSEVHSYERGTSFHVLMSEVLLFMYRDSYERGTPVHVQGNTAH